MSTALRFFLAIRLCIIHIYSLKTLSLTHAIKMNKLFLLLLSYKMKFSVQSNTLDARSLAFHVNA